MSERIRAIAAAMQGAKFDVNASEKIVQDMWDKWVFLATLAGATCLFRGSVGDILAAPQGAERMLDLLEECRAVANANGYAPRADVSERMRKTLTTASSFTASMLRDIESNARIEADHIIGIPTSRLIKRDESASYSDVRVLQPIKDKYVTQLVQQQPPAPAHATGCRGRTKFTQAPRSARTATPALRSGEVGEPASSPGRPALPVV